MRNVRAGSIAAQGSGGSTLARVAHPSLCRVAKTRDLGDQADMFASEEEARDPDVRGDLPLPFFPHRVLFFPELKSLAPLKLVELDG